MKKFMIAALIAAVASQLLDARTIHPLAKRTIKKVFLKLEKENRLDELSPEFLTMHESINSPFNSYDEDTLIAVMKEAFKHTPHRKSLRNHTIK